MSTKHNSQIDRFPNHNIHHLHQNQPIPTHPSKHHLLRYHPFQTCLPTLPPLPNYSRRKVPPSPIPSQNLSQFIPRLSPSPLPKPASRTRSRKLGTQALSFGLQRARQSLESQRTTPLATWRAASNHGIGETSVANECRVQKKKERSTEIMKLNGMG